MNGIHLIFAVVAVLGLGTLAVSIPPLVNAWLNDAPARLLHLAKRGWLFFALDEIGGYIHDTAMSQYIPCTAMHYVTGTWAMAAGQVAGTIAYHKTANAETAVVNVPILLPSNSVAQKGAYLKSIEIDYEQLVAGTTSTTLTLNKVTRGVDGAVAVVSAVTITVDLSAATSKSQDQHKIIGTLSTPAWIDNDEYYLAVLTFVCGASVTLDVLSAVANYTMRI